MGLTGMGNGKEFSQGKKILKKLNELIDDKRIGQRELAAYCNSLGYSVSQSAISKILTGTQKLTIDHMEMFADVLGVPFDILMEMCCRADDSGRLFLHLGLGEQNLAMNPEKESVIYNGYMGDFYVYFLSTSKTEQGKVIEGELRINSQDGYCRAEMQINTISGTKVHTGQMMISKEMKTGYIFLLNPDSGEISSIYLRYRRMYSILQVRLGLMLTISSGDSALPTTGYILLNRKRIEKKHFGDVAHILKMEQDYYWISDFGEGLDCPVQLNVQPKDAKVYSIDAGMLERGMEKEENPETYLRLLSWIKGNSLNTIEHVEVNDRVDLSIFRSFYSTYPNARDG
ncbi:hypothetical protein IMSAGC002_01470 [Lachnospiraceae bacterium]|nr:hypothetical protein IMSAGC002_01470 [Lachnospiraceae bacterium]